MKIDKNTFLKVLADHKLIVFKVCRSYCQNQEDQKDLAQEIIYQLWNAFDKYNDEFKLSTWVYRIALNVAISNYRKTQTQNKYFTPLDEEMVSISVEENSDRKEDLELLQTFIGQLDSLNKALMILYLDGHSHKEISEMLDISTSNVGSKINRIKIKIKKYFKEIES